MDRKIPPKGKDLKNSATLGGKNKFNNSVKSDSTASKTNSSVDKRQTFINLIAKYCDKCGTPYTIDNVRIVKESEFSSIIHFGCSNCKSNHVATFFKPMGLSSRSPINTDLTVDEVGEYARKGKVMADEILDLYNELYKE